MDPFIEALGDVNQMADMIFRLKFQLSEYKQPDPTLLKALAERADKVERLFSVPYAQFLEQEYAKTRLGICA